MAFNNFKQTYLELLPNEIQDHINYIINKSNYEILLKELEYETKLNYDIDNPTKYHKIVLFLLEYYKLDNYASIPFIDFTVWLNNIKPTIGKNRTLYIRKLLNELYDDLYFSFSSYKSQKFFDNIRLVLYNLSFMELLSFKYFMGL